MKGKKYLILFADNCINLENKVNQALNDEYKLHGVPFVNSNNKWYQAMIRGDLVI